MCKPAYIDLRIASAQPYFTLAALLLALGWLLPNHYYPWASFHSEAWVAVSLAVIGAIALIATREHIHWHWISLIVALITPLPLLQHLFGLLPFLGDALTSSLFLLGLLLALLCGDTWQRWQADKLANIIFLAIGIAALLSVCLQTYQWLGLANDPMATPNWAYVLIGARPYANLGQPNQLATLLVWGLLAGAWGAQKGYIGTSTSLIYSGYLAFGLALTGSRTGSLELLILVTAAWYWRRKWSSRAAPWLITLLGCYFLLLAFMLDSISPIAGSNSLAGIASRTSTGTEVRPALWWMLLDAATLAPLFGYGWNQVLPAQIITLLDHPAVHGTAFGHSHNLFIDFLIWAGIPIGLLLSISLLFWILKTFKAVTRPEDAILLLVVLTVGLHAMLELPLHYAYFLLPTGLVMGMLNASTSPTTRFSTHRGAALLLWVTGCLLLALTIVDYFRIEASTFALRLEKAEIKSKTPIETPSVVALSQLRDNITLARVQVRPGMSHDDISWIQNVVTSFPSISNLNKLSTALALNDRSEEASLWLRRTCPLLRIEYCEIARQRWEESRRAFPERPMPAWPKESLIN